MERKTRSGQSSSAGPHRRVPLSCATCRGPSQTARMRILSLLNGRMDKRLPIAMVVQLAQAQDQPISGPEMTYTDNVSVNGARVVSSRAWQTGEMEIGRASCRERVWM